MIINRQSLLQLAPIKNMETEKKREHGVSYGLAEAGYDIRIAEEVYFSGSGANCISKIETFVDDSVDFDLEQADGHIDGIGFSGNFTIASAIEEFQMPDKLVGLVKDKSTWARRGLSVFNTVIEPGWKGFLTLELVYHGFDELIIPKGAGIAQVLFEESLNSGQYEGKYQNQEAGAQESRFE